MKQTRQEALDYVLQMVQGLCQDWDYADPVGPDALLFTGLGLESLDAVVLGTAIQEHYRIQMPFAELLADIGEKRRDLSIAELADFVNQHVNAAAAQEATTGRQEVEVGSPAAPVAKGGAPCSGDLQTPKIALASSSTAP
jgi:acyl carrier protein